MAALTCLPNPLSLLQRTPNPQLFTKNPSFQSIPTNQKHIHKSCIILECSNFNLSSVTLSESEYEAGTDEEDENGVTLAPLKRKRRRYRKQYPGENKGITEEMRFVAMKLRNSKVKEKLHSKDDEMKEDDDTWQPSIQGFIKFLVDSNLVFTTIERIVDDSSDVSYAYFRRTGLERAECISKDLEWFSQQGHVIPVPSNSGVSYANYLEELAEKTPPLFLCHFYNIYFSHITGGQVIAKKAFEKLLEEEELEFYKWEGDAEELLRGVREKLNMLAKHWSRDDKNKCLREATKAFRFLESLRISLFSIARGFYWTLVEGILWYITIYIEKECSAMCSTQPWKHFISMH